MALATPIGVGVAVWLSEYARPRPLARVVESTVEMFAGAPSIVLALFGVILFRASFLGFLTEKTGGVVYGKGFFPAGAMLSLLALPLVVTSVREGLQAVPNHVREASYALGKTKIATIRRVLLPAVRPDIITGSMIGAGHAIGDTAIIVFLLGDTYMLAGRRATSRCSGHSARHREHAHELHLRQRPDGRPQPAEQGLRGSARAAGHGPDHQRLRRHLWPQGKGAEMDLTLQPPPVRQLEAGSTLTVRPGRSNAHVHGLEDLARRHDAAAASPRRSTPWCRRSSACASSSSRSATARSRLSVRSRCRYARARCWR